MPVQWSKLNRVAQLATSGYGAGDAAFTLSPTPYLSDLAIIPPDFDGIELYYFVQHTPDNDYPEYEVGRGIYTDATRTLARTTIEQSSNAGAKVGFSAVPLVIVAPTGHWYELMETGLENLQALDEIQGQTGFTP